MLTVAGDYAKDTDVAAVIGHWGFDFSMAAAQVYENAGILTNYGRVGYRKVTLMLRNMGTKVNHKRVERIWREEGLKLPHKQQKKRRLWLTDGSCVRLRPEHRNHVWSYDFVEDKTRNGRKIRILNIIDEHTRECLASVPRRSWNSSQVIELLSDLMFRRGTPEYLRIIAARVSLAALSKK